MSDCFLKPLTLQEDPRHVVPPRMAARRHSRRAHWLERPCGGGTSPSPREGPASSWCREEVACPGRLQARVQASAPLLASVPSCVGFWQRQRGLPRSGLGAIVSPKQQGGAETPGPSLGGGPPGSGTRTRAPSDSSHRRGNTQSSRPCHSGTKLKTTGAIAKPRRSSERSGGTGMGRAIASAPLPRRVDGLPFRQASSIPRPSRSRLGGAHCESDIKQADLAAGLHGRRGQARAPLGARASVRVFGADLSGDVPYEGPGPALPPGIAFAFSASLRAQEEPDRPRPWAARSDPGWRPRAAPCWPPALVAACFGGARSAGSQGLEGVVPRGGPDPRR